MVLHSRRQVAGVIRAVDTAVTRAGALKYGTGADSAVTVDERHLGHGCD